MGWTKLFRCAHLLKRQRKNKKNGLSILNSKEIASSEVLFQMIFKDLQSELFR